MSSDLSSRGIVKQCVHFGRPPRIAFKLAKPWPSDVRGVSRGTAPNRKTTAWTQAGSFMEMIDEWGNTWRRIGGRTKGEVSHGVVEEGWECLDSYQWPDVTAPEIWQQAEERCAAFHRDGYYVFGSVNWPFAAARSMRRLENFLYDLAADRHSAMRLLNGAANVVEKEIEGYARIGADGVVTWEDWGMQDRLLVSPTMWREVFKPLFKRLCDAAHAGGMDVWLHSCGHVTDVIEDLIQVGVEVCMFDQPELHGIDFLARNFGGRMAFCTPVDIQRTLQTRDIGRIEAAARQYVETLGAFGGGFVADFYGDNEGIGLAPEYQQAACRAFVRHGDPENLLRLPEELR